MGIVWALALGMGAGLVAKAWFPTRRPAGFSLAVALRAACPLALDFIAQQNGWDESAGEMAILDAIAGALAGLACYRGASSALAKPIRH